MERRRAVIICKRDFDCGDLKKATINICKKGDSMKKIALSAVLVLLLASCSWTLQLNPVIGKKYLVIEPEKVLIYNEPSFKGEPFTLDKPETFEVKALECADNAAAISCVSKLTSMEEAEKSGLLYKVRFDSGKEGYISQKYFYFDTAPIVWLNSPDVLGTALFRDDYDRVWDAALDTLDEHGFVIKHMRKKDGYITTEMRKQDVYFRIKISVRLARVDDAVRVTVNDYSESAQVYDEVNHRPLRFWQGNAPSGEYRREIIIGIEEKLKHKR